MPLEQKISCRSRKGTFNTEMEQQWQQNQGDISEEEFVHTLNFFCNLQSPDRTKFSDNNQERFNGNYDDLTDIEDFKGNGDDTEDEYEVLPQIDYQQPRQFNKRKQVSLCRHKLKNRAHGQSRCGRQATDLQPNLSELKEEDTDHEWAQLKNWEKFIEKQKQKLLKHGFRDSDDENDGWNEQPEPEDDSVEEIENSFDDNDLAYITAILESFSGPKANSKSTNASNYANFTPEGTPPQAPAKPTTKPEFNQKFNQNFNKNLTSNNSEAEDFSCFSTIWEEGTTELADYYSDEEEDDSLNNEDTRIEKNSWNKLELDELGEISDDEDTWSDAEPNNFEADNLVNYEKPGDKAMCTAISSLSVEAAQAFSAWQPYIPPNHAFQNFSAHSYWLDSSQQASFSQEPTLTQISSIRGPKSTITPSPAPKMFQHKRQMRQSPPQDWKPSRPAMKPYTRIWSKPWPESNRTYRRARSWLNEFQDHPEQSKQFKHWKQPSQCSIEATRSPNSKFLNTPPETNAGDAHPVFTQYPSWTFSSMMSNENTTKIKSLETKSRRSSNKIQTYLTKFRKPIGLLWKNSKRTLSWPWSPKQWPPTCSSGTTTGIKEFPKQPISPHGRNHFSKRRSESESYSESQSKSRRYKNKNRKKDSESSKRESEGEIKSIQAESENKIMTVTTHSKTNETAKADEVKTLNRTKNESRIRLRKRLGRMIEPDLQVSPHLHFTTAFIIPIVIFIYFLFDISIFIFNYLLLDHLDHHFQTFTFGNLRVCEQHYSSRKTASLWAKTAVTPLAIPESTRSLRDPGP